MGGFNPLPNPVLYKTMPDAYIGMGLTAENVAKKFHVERAAQEAFAIASHQKAAAASFADEITPITTKRGWWIRMGRFVQVRHPRIWRS